MVVLDVVLVVEVVDVVVVLLVVDVVLVVVVQQSGSQKGTGRTGRGARQVQASRPS